MSANDLSNFWDQTFSKWPFSGHFKFCNIYLTQEMQNDWTMTTRITHDKFHTKKSKMAAIGQFFYYFFSTFFFLSLFQKSCMIADLCFSDLINFLEQTILK